MVERPRGGKPPGTRSGKQAAQPRVATSVPIEDDQLVEVSELRPFPHARVVVVETSAGDLTRARTAVVAQGFEVLAAVAGGDAAAGVIGRLSEDPAPDVVVVGLPGGEPVLDAALALEPRRPVVVAAVTGVGKSAAERAHAAGADLVALRPHEPERLGPVLFAAARLAEERRELLTTRGAEARLRDRLSRYGRADSVTGFQQLEFFQRVLELEIKRARRYGYALSVCLLRRLDPPGASRAVARELHRKAASAVAAAIRDIDLPVELDDDRFLVLLPYTHGEGAALVAQRVVAAVARQTLERGATSWRPRVVAGVAGVVGGSGELSFARLMRDATTALRAAEEQGEDVMIL